MKDAQYEKVCYRTDQREENVRLKNLKTGEIGYSVGCTKAGTTIQIRLENGDRDTWLREDCLELNGE